jgi:SAM-dependent methyltransferase
MSDLKNKKKVSCCSDDCCGESKEATNTAIVADAVREKVRIGYSAIAKSGSWSAAVAAEPQPAGSCCGGSASSGGGCCGPTTFSAEQLASAIGYVKDELNTVPDGANMGLSCGNPTAIASLKSGEIVLDLGSGGGFDCFIAGKKVGAAGKVIGVDMTPDMLTKARRNIEVYRKQTALNNVEFRLGEIENLPVADSSVDVVISNCVLNLSPDKPQVWREISRVLKPGGRVAVSDLALLRPLPESVRVNVEALIGCVAGAVLIEEMRKMATDVGLSDIVLTAKPQYIDAMTNWEDPLYKNIVQSLPVGTKPSDFVTSLDISARKR